MFSLLLLSAVIVVLSDHSKECAGKKCHTWASSFAKEEQAEGVMLLQVQSLKTLKEARKAEEQGRAKFITDREAIKDEQIDLHAESSLTVAMSSELPPDVIIQYGLNRTATTLQYVTLCAIMTLLHKAEPEKVDCFFQSELLEPESNATYKVIKMHNPKLLNQTMHQLLQRNVNVWLFATAKNDTVGYSNITDWGPTTEALTEQIGFDVKYAQILTLVSARGHTIISDYLSMTGLPTNETDVLMEFIGYWDTLRQCCGTQMSEKWRDVLQHRSETYPACDIYNIDALESALLNTQMYQRFHESGPRALFQVSSTDQKHYGLLTGRYCSWINRQIACQGLPFNEVPKEPFC